ncbi:MULTISPECIES: restriction endonuclease subunit S [Acinetobacter]|uniref:Restriction endonuclease subunit S n=1 Tax=Acinetobacter genomosp. 15BJ TaxID=106651 RepID=A0ABT8UW16_9GAMM|nr:MULTISPECIES: restriction endonuclease subunit S [Acinetobacter]ENW18017.1 hypothetical protein F926_03151 [Acinetobacter haemolyticus NIPH 261]MDO3657251.1 restriction endonuclease subunit S [Acinetobacter genomosp. 15BJ]
MSEINLPEKWLLTKFTEVLDIQGGTQPPKSQFIDEPRNGYVRLLQIRDFGAKPVPTYIPETPTLKRCYKNDILIGRYGASLGRICSGMEGAYNVALAKVISGNFLDKRFLKGYLESEMFQQPLAMLSRSAQNGFNKEDLSTFDFVLPPLEEQKAIAEKLDTLLTQVELTKAHLEHIPKLLKNFRQSVLAAAVNGKLTESWRQNKQVNWTKSILANICRSVSDGDHQAPPKADSGIPFLVISNIRNGAIDFDSVNRWVPESYYESLKDIRKPEKNDILYTVTGSFGIPVIVKSTAPFCFQRHIAIIKPDHSSVDYKYLFYYLASPEVFKHADLVATGTAQKTVSLSHLRNFNILLPTIEEQVEIVRRVEKLLAFADSIEQKLDVALARVNNLTQSILIKAFTGELTAEWRVANSELISGDNSAEILLKKIKAERKAVKIQSKLKRKAVQEKTGALMNKQIIKVVEALKQAGEPLSGQQLLAATGYPNDSSTDQLELFFLDIRDALTIEKSIVKLERGDDGQDWFALAQAATNK